jgi:sugar/nucleoside kinase (ribokinase family)
LGPKIVVIKRGEYGALLFHENKFFSIPGLPLALVKDPTGAGDTFAGGFMGYLASQNPSVLDEKTLRKAVVYGCVMASFTVQDFGFHELLKVNADRISQRFQEFINLTQFDLAGA